MKGRNTGCRGGRRSCRAGVSSACAAGSASRQRSALARRRLLRWELLSFATGRETGWASEWAGAVGGCLVMIDAVDSFAEALAAGVDELGAAVTHGWAGRIRAGILGEPILGG